MTAHYELVLGVSSRQAAIGAILCCSFHGLQVLGLRRQHHLRQYGAGELEGAVSEGRFEK